jgi:hypothetical protein
VSLDQLDYFPQAYKFVLSCNFCSSEQTKRQGRMNQDRVKLFVIFFIPSLIVLATVVYFFHVADAKENFKTFATFRPKTWRIVHFNGNSFKTCKIEPKENQNLGTEIDFVSLWNKSEEIHKYTVEFIKKRERNQKEKLNRNFHQKISKLKKHFEKKERLLLQKNKKLEKENEERTKEVERLDSEILKLIQKSETESNRIVQKEMELNQTHLEQMEILLQKIKTLEKEKLLKKRDNEKTKETFTAAWICHNKMSTWKEKQKEIHFLSPKKDENVISTNQPREGKVSIFKLQRLPTEKFKKKLLKIWNSLTCLNYEISVTLFCFSISISISLILFFMTMKRQQEFEKLFFQNKSSL